MGHWDEVEPAKENKKEQLGQEEENQYLQFKEKRSVS